MKDIKELFIDQKPTTLSGRLSEAWSNIRFYLWDIPKDFVRKIKLYVKNAYYYREFLSSSYDFDYGYLLGMIRFKLIRMKAYFETSHIIAEAPIIAREINLAINLLDIILDTDKEEHPNLFYVPTRVNDRNAKRFIKYYERKCDINTASPYFTPEQLHDMMLWDLRREKAYNLFFLYLSQRMRSWWD